MNAGIAQTVEHRTCNANVAGSIPAPGSRLVMENIDKIISRENFIALERIACTNPSKQIEEAVKTAVRERCARCWMYCPTVGFDQKLAGWDLPPLCSKCILALREGCRMSDEELLMHLGQEGLNTFIELRKIFSVPRRL